MTCGPGTWSRPSSPMPSMTAFGRSRVATTATGRWWPTGGRPTRPGEQPVIYGHRRAQVDQLNAVCQRLRAEAGQLGSERLVVGDRSLAVGDVVVLGANARGRLGE